MMKKSIQFSIATLMVAAVMGACREHSQEAAAPTEQTITTGTVLTYTATTTMYSEPLDGSKSGTSVADGFYRDVRDVRVVVDEQQQNVEKFTQVTQTSFDNGKYQPNMERLIVERNGHRMALNSAGKMLYSSEPDCELPQETAADVLKTASERADMLSQALAVLTESGEVEVEQGEYVTKVTARYTETHTDGTQEQMSTVTWFNNYYGVPVKTEVLNSHGQPRSTLIQLYEVVGDDVPVLAYDHSIVYETLPDGRVIKHSVITEHSNINLTNL